MDNWTVSTGQYVRQSCFVGHIFAENIGDVDDDADDDIDNDGDGDNAENSDEGDGDNICGGK